jgi:hypothetical protein
MSEAIKDSTLVAAMRDLMTDVSDLVRKEVRLARAEITQIATKGVQAGVWMAAAGVIGLIAILFLIQAIVFGLASLGLGVGWASLIVAIVLAAIAGGLFFYGRALARGSFTPQRTLDQISRDIHAVRSD